MFCSILDPNNLGGEILRLQQAVRRGESSAVFGVPLAAKCHLAATSAEHFLYIAKDHLAAEEAAQHLADYAEGVVYLPQKDDVLLYKKALSGESRNRRLYALSKIAAGATRVVTTLPALMQLFPANVGYATLSEGQEEIEEDFIARLRELGYTRVDTVSGEGTFAVRGDLIDVYPPAEKEPYRVSFFGDEVERIRTFDPKTGESGDRVQSIFLSAAKECSLKESDVKTVTDRLKRELLSAGNLTPEADHRRRAVAEDLVEGAEKNAKEAAEFLFPLLPGATADLLSLLPPDTVVFFDESKMIADAAAYYEKEFSERYSELLAAGEVFSFTKWQLVTAEDALSFLREKTMVAMQNVTTTVPFFSPRNIFQIKAGAVSDYSKSLAALATDISGWKITGYRVAVFTGSASRSENLQKILAEGGVSVRTVKTLPETFTGAVLTEEPLRFGVIYHEAKLVIIGENDLYRVKKQEKRVKHRRNDFFTAPEAGDYAVHETHGVGLVKGTKKITTSEGTKDYVMLEYGGGDMLYVPVEQMDSLSRYMGGDVAPKLNKIGGKDFERIKERVRASVKALAVDLKALYRRRFEKKGFRFETDNALTRQFDEDFPYELTEDQKRSADEILADMASDKVMDRLLCGDVGYGKTEVAFRAVFRAILNGKQAALLCPTTVLSQQHYETAMKRFANFPVRIAVLNRFRSDKEIRETLSALAEGKIDFVIGTHRLLSDDVKFKDLGLLVLDEEQRFGVEHKEKIKEVRSDVDCLSMSATPIPRTLHMSLAGIRDISTIETPIKERLPVQTYVVEETDALIRDAIVRELSRGGQAFVLYNRVQSIDRFAARFSAIVPEAKVCVAHGQMPERVLEERIMSFFSGKTDVLISTTIVENGIDLPNANTLIVIDAERLGLSQLYQLKGRVGRSNRLAHAYFTFKRDKVLTETAYKRLSAIMDFTEMNSGYKIAMRDLEIRGAGNVLGAEQHGHMDKIGYELYARLMREALTGEEDREISLDLRVSAFIPESYIESAAGRMDAYKQIAEIRNGEDLKRVRDSLVDIYGKIPEEVETLLRIAVLKVRAKRFAVSELYIKNGEAGVVLTGLSALSDGRLQRAMEGFFCPASLVMGEKPTITFRPKLQKQEKFVDLLSEFLKIAASGAKKS